MPKKVIKKYKKTGIVGGKKANKKMNKSLAKAKTSADKARKYSHAEHGPQMTKLA